MIMVKWWVYHKTTVLNCILNLLTGGHEAISYANIEANTNFQEKCQPTYILPYWYHDGCVDSSNSDYDSLVEYLF